MIRFLQQKGQLQRVLLVGFLGLLCIGMVAYLVPGLQDALGKSSPDVIAKVGSREITIQEVQKQAQAMVQQQMRGQNIPPQYAQFFMQSAVPRAAEGLILQNVFLAEAKRLGIGATDDEVRNLLQHGALAEQLFPNGQFIGNDQYAQFVSTNFNMTVPQFEEMVKKELTIGKLRDMVTSGATVSNQEMMDAFRKQGVKLKVQYALLNADSLAKGINPSDAELRAYYEKNQKQFENMIPEQRKVRYIVIDPLKLANTSKPSDADLQAYYKQHQDEYRVPESVTVRHILIKTPEGADQKTTNAAKSKADDILKQLKAGAKFADLAKKYSDDPGSKAQGGELGPISRGRTVPEFEQAAFGAKKGDLVGPVKTQYGFHIIQVEDKTDAHMKSLAEVRPQIEPMLARQNAQGVAEKLARTVETEAHTQGLDKAAAQHGLTVINSAFFSRGESLPGVGTAQAFSDYVFGNKPSSPATAVATAQSWAVVQVADVKPARTPTFDEVKPRLAMQLRNQQAQSLLAKKTQEFAEKAKAQHSITAAAKEFGATVKTSDLVSPTQQIPDIGALSNALDASKFNVGQISDAVRTQSGGAVVQVIEKQEPSQAEFEAAKDEVRTSLLNNKRNELLDVYISNLRDKMQKAGKITINQKQLDKLSAAAASSNGGGE